jgi:hypothetical protein
MRHYEVMVILDPELEERTVAPSLDAFLNVVKNDGGSVEKVDVWGRRQLYEIRRSRGITRCSTCSPAARPARPPAQPQRGRAAQVMKVGK